MERNIIRIRNIVKYRFFRSLSGGTGPYLLHMRKAPRSVRPLRESEAALENWLRTEGVARYDAYKRDPKGEPAEEVFARLKKHDVEKRRHRRRRAD
jgi:hypothetical protein